ncbi:MAG TPA: DivIVA domain-containing protein [Nitrospiraceae bacterium]|nr:DivIVA domain-containing protein [Nitrospiraceae bacterium]
MKITPLDIQQMVFAVRMRGYDRQEVKQFLEEIAQTVEALNHENATLRERLSSTEAQLAELKKTEATLTHTLVSTQALADDLKEVAQRDAALLVKEGEMKAAELLREARAELAATQRDISDLRKQRILGIERLRSTLRTFERMLEIEEGEADAESSDHAEKMTGGANY